MTGIEHWPGLWTFNDTLGWLPRDDWGAWLKMIEAQRAWDALVLKNMAACPWLFTPLPEPPDVQ